MSSQGRMRIIQAGVDIGYRHSASSRVASRLSCPNELESRLILVPVRRRCAVDLDNAKSRMRGFGYTVVNFEPFDAHQTQRVAQQPQYWRNERQIGNVHQDY